MGYDTPLEYHFPTRRNIALIGCGIRCRELLNSLRELNMNTHIAAICDPRGKEAITDLHEEGEDTRDTVLFEDADEMLDLVKPNGVIVATRNETHVMYAKKVISRDIPLLLEKPITTSLEELKELRDVYSKSKKRVIVSFPLRVSPIAELAREIISSGRIGTVEHIQAFNYVPYGGVYYHNWYRNAGFGGLFFEKSTHDFDCINYLADSEPVEIAAMVSNQIFGGDYPAEKRCSECDRQLTCMESPFILKNFAIDCALGDLCAYSQSVKNHDSAGVLIRYKSGMHANYSENFFARKGAAVRGERLTGYRGTLDFDWYTNKITVHMHHTPRVDTYAFDDSKMEHFGGDKKLMFDFIRLIDGEPVTGATLEAGFISTLMCIAARKSAAERIFAPVSWKE